MAFDQALPTIHLIDDDPVILDSLNMVLELEGYSVRTYASARIFLQNSWHRDGDCIVTDVDMPEMSGLDLLAALAARNNDAPVIVMTGRADARLKAAALKLGAFDLLSKHADIDTLIASLDAALKGGDELHSFPAGRFTPAHLGGSPAM
jgi:FixJ family two-component response regulator